MDTLSPNVHSKSLCQIANCNCGGTNFVILVEPNSHTELDTCKNTFNLKNFKVR